MAASRPAIIGRSSLEPATRAGNGSARGLLCATQPQHLLLALAVVATFIAYAGTLGFEFVYDDRTQIVSGPFVHFWHFVPQYFTSHVWSYQYPHMLGNYYRPLFLLWLRLNDAAFGLHPWPWHLMCILLHVGVTSLVYLLTRRLTRDAFAAGAAALIFGLHPAHVEAVSYVSAVPETLNALLLLSAFICFLRWGEPGDPRARGWLAASLLFYALAMLSKESALILPLLVFAYGWVDSPETGDGPWLRRFGQSFRLALPYVLLTLPYLLARDLALKGLTHPVNSLPLSTLLLTAPGLVLFYFKLLVWPVGLSAFYGASYVTRPGQVNFVLPLVAIAAVALGLWFWSQHPSRQHSTMPQEESRAIVFAAVWLALPMLLLLNLRVFPPDEIAHDRYLYLPSIGFAMLAALALRRFNLGRAKWFGWPCAQVLLALALAAALGAGTVYQSLYWSDELSLYGHSHRVAPRNDAAATSLAAVACERKLYAPCIELYQEVLARNPGFWRANVNLGYTYYELGQIARAAEYFRRAIAADPVDGNQYLYLGLCLFRMGHLDEAQAAVRRALVMRPNGPDYHYVLGIILRAQGLLPEALAEFQAELAQNPENQRARAQIAEIQKALRRP